MSRAAFYRLSFRLGYTVGLIVGIGLFVRLTLKRIPRIFAKKRRHQLQDHPHHPSSFFN